jgi:hypothetical protein
MHRTGAYLCINAKDGALSRCACSSIAFNKDEGDSMSNTARMLAERKFARLQITEDAARNQIEEEAAARAKKIARLRNLRLAAIGDETESVTRTKITKSNRP